MNGQSQDLLEHSVTAGDLGHYQNNGVVNFNVPWLLSALSNYPLPTELPPYWSLRFGVAAYWSRDLILRSTILHESFWAGAVAKIASKASAKSWDLSGPRSARFQQMLLDWGGDGYVPSMQRGMLDWLTCNNGEWWEIVRATSAAGSRILGLVHLDSLRVIRTGDPSVPALFQDLQGRLHELRDYQVFSMVSLPDPAAASLGIGHCSAERAYDQIYKQMVIEQYIKEKVTGMGANSLHFVTGVTGDQIESITTTARAETTRKGQVYFQGNIIAGILAKVDMQHVEIKLRDLPDGFDREKELEIAHLAYANAIGVDPQDINPRLLGRGSLGIGQQAQVLHEKQEGYGPAARDKQLTQFLNQNILPDSVTFAFAEADLREQNTQADIELKREQKRNSMIMNGEITAAQGLQMAVDSGDAPKEFITVDQTEDTALGDEEQPVQTEQQAPIIETQITEALPAPVIDTQKEMDLLLSLKQSIDAARLDLLHATEPTPVIVNVPETVVNLPAPVVNLPAPQIAFTPPSDGGYQAQSINLLTQIKQGMNKLGEMFKDMPAPVVNYTPPQNEPPIINLPAPQVVLQKEKDKGRKVAYKFKHDAEGNVIGAETDSKSITFDVDKSGKITGATVKEK